MKKRIYLLMIVLVTMLFVGCNNSESSLSGNLGNNSGTSVQQTTAAQNLPENLQEEKTEPLQSTAQSDEQEEQGEMKLNINVNGRDFTATLEENESAAALVEMINGGEITIEMSDYGGFEKVGSLGRSLPANNSQTTTRSGDIVLYQGNQIVMFYGSNSWSYTLLGRIDNLDGWEDALSGGSVTVKMTVTNYR